MHRKNYDYKSYRSMLTALLGVVFLVFTGCAGEMISGDANSTIIDSFFETSPMGDAGQEVLNARCIPGILVDRNGYEAQALKRVVFRGENLDLNYEVVDARTNQVAYSGRMEACVTTSQDGEYNYLGDFTSLTTPGQYYITNATVGESYEFTIQNSIYENLNAQVLQSFYLNRCGTDINADVAGNYAHDACHKQDLKNENQETVSVSGGWHTDALGNRDVMSGCLSATYMLTAYELHPDAFTEDVSSIYTESNIPDVLEEVAYEMDWLLKMQQEDGGVCGGVYINASGENGTSTGNDEMTLQPVSYQATAAFAAVASQFGRIYRNYDSTYADQCLHSAEMAYQYSMNYADTNIKYLASTQLYKTTGKYNYRVDAETILRTEMLTETSKLDSAVFLADIAYLTIPQKADSALCDIRMTGFTDHSKQIMDASQADSYLIGDMDSGENSEIIPILSEIQCTSFVNYVIPNRESRSIIEEHLHFIGGRNPEAENCLTMSGLVSTTADVTDSSKPCGNTYANAMLLFILGIYV